MLLFLKSPTMALLVTDDGEGDVESEPSVGTGVE